MAMPASGCIQLRECYVGVPCSSIACAVNYTLVGSCSLSTLSTTAGKTAPHCMREFYGYSKDPVPVYLTTTASYGDADNAYCCMRIDGIATGCAYLCTYWLLTNGSTSTYSCSSICMVCNGTCVWGHYLCQNNIIVDGVHSNLIDENDSVCYIGRSICGLNGGGQYFTAIGCLCAITNVIGNYCLGTPDTIITTVPLI